MRVLLLGATGHIGQGIARRLLADGIEVHGLARRPCAPSRTLSQVHWHFGDLNRMTSVEDWQDLTRGVTAVINAAGVLQDGLGDNLDATHERSVSALCTATDSSTLLIHISAPGASISSSTAFYRSKAKGDAAVKRSGRPWVILRPCVVVSPEAYGGTALLRALSAFPLFIPAANPDALIQTVSLDDVAAAVSAASDGRIPPASDIVLGEPQAEPIRNVLGRFRQWHGLPEAPVLPVPVLAARVISLFADAAGYLGWRSPLRSTAMTVAAENVTGTSGYACRSLAEQLATMPATVQERWFARAYLMKPLAIVTLALFWLISGIIGLVALPAAASVLTQAGFSASTASSFVIAGACADVLLGTLVLVRRTMALALIGMILLTAAYLGAATLFTPALWLDPLGPLVKSVPAAMLALLLLAIEPER